MQQPLSWWQSKAFSVLKSGKYKKNTEKSPINPSDSEVTCLLALQTARNSLALLPSQEGELRGICGEEGLQLLRAPQGRFFTVWATREALMLSLRLISFVLETFFFFLPCLPTELILCFRPPLQLSPFAVAQPDSLSNLCSWQLLI